MRWMWWMRWKKIIHRFLSSGELFFSPLDAVKKKFTTFHRISYKNSPHLLSNVYSIWFKFTRNAKVVSDSWGSGVSSWRHAGGQRIEPVWGRFFFVRILRTRWKKIIHRDSPHSPQKDVRNTRWKLFFSPHFTAFLTKIHHQTSTRDGILCIILHFFSEWVLSTV